MRWWWWWEREREREREQEEGRERERRKRVSFGEREAEGALQGRRQQQEAQILQEGEQGEWAVGLEAAEDDAIQDAMPAQVRAAIAVCGACAARATDVTRPSLCMCMCMRVHVPVCVCVRARAADSKGDARQVVLPTAKGKPVPCALAAGHAHLLVLSRFAPSMPRGCAMPAPLAGCVRSCHLVALLQLSIELGCVRRFDMGSPALMRPRPHPQR